MHHFVAELEERQRRELLIRALGFLHCEHVDLGALQPIEYAVQPGANRVHVPGSYSQVRRSQARRSRAQRVATINHAVGHGPDPTEGPRLPR